MEVKLGFLSKRLIVICGTKRNEMKICNLRNGNTLLIYQIEICNLRNNYVETQENRRANWVNYIFLANMIFHLETWCDTFHAHFQSGECRVTHSNYSSTTYINYTL